ncbi:MAG: DUF3047 domain-containing protein [Rhodospirillaceae bacterium]|nr:DUF3047 domain-containing protein [Rhodospirillaceae bacterium]
MIENFRYSNAVLMIFLVFLLSACAEVKTKNVTPEGRLDVLGPTSQLTPELIDKNMPPDWVLIGKSTANNIKINPIEGVPGIGLTSSDESLLAVRRVGAMMLATPYLSWAWNITDHGDGIHPVRIIVGFKNNTINTKPDFFSLAGMGLNNTYLGNADLPVHNRAISIVWGDSALGRGSLRLPVVGAGTHEAPLYMPRGGRENTNKWWMETVDLSNIYKRAWPNDNARDVAISFIGIAASPGRPGHRGRISGIVLSR